MKNLKYIFLYFFCLFFFNGHSQTSYYLKIDNEKMFPNSNKTTEDKIFNDIIKRYGVKEFKQAFPTIKDKWLKSIYTIEIENKFSQEDINHFLNNGISLVEKIEITPQLTGNECENPNDKSIGQTNLNLIKIDSAWKYACGLPILPIAILDKSFDIQHEDLADNVIGYDGNISNTNFHGTAVAGIVSAVSNNGIGIAGTGMNAKLYLSSTNWAEDSGVLRLAQMGYRVINCSWMNSCFYSTVADNLYRHIRDEYNSVVVFGAGNGTEHCGSLSALVYPASYSSVLSVTSVGHMKEIGTIDEWGSNNWKDCHEQIIGSATTAYHHNNMVDLCAPGYNVLTTHPNNIYSGAWGTSFSAPQVSATVNLMASINPCLSAQDLINMVKATTDPSIYDIPENSNYIGLLGTGRLDANNAIKAAVESATIRITNNLNITTNRSIESNYRIIVNAPVHVSNNKSLTLKTRKNVDITGDLSVDSGSEFSIDVDLNNVINCNNSY